MYRFLRRHFRPSVANVLTAVWYALLIVFVLYCAFEPRAEFTYLLL